MKKSSYESSPKLGWLLIMNVVIHQETAISIEQAFQQKDYNIQDSEDEDKHIVSNKVHLILQNCFVF